MRRRKHLVGSCGGSKAIVGIAGLCWTLSRLLGWQLADWVSIGGSSGSAIIQTIMCGSGLSAAEVVHLTLTTDFSQYVDCPQASWWQCLRARLRHEGAEAIRPWPTEAPMNSEPLGAFIDTHVRGPWPKPLWMLAADHDGLPVLFSEAGVRRWKMDGSLEVLSRTPPPTGLAVRAAISIPLLFAPPQVPLDSGCLPMWDGAFTGERTLFGLCPVEVPMNYMGAAADEMLAFDVSEEPSQRGLQGMLRYLLRHYWWGIDDPPWPSKAQETIRISPRMPFSALDLRLSLDDKFQMVAHTIAVTTRACLQHNLVPREEEATATNLLEAIRPFSKAELSGNRRSGFINDLKLTLNTYGFVLSL
jgi:hypothetical protein